MKNIYKLTNRPTLEIALLFFLCICADTSFAEENQLKDVIKKVMPATVLIVTYDADGKPIQQGSGFFISEKGEVITNYHVLRGAESAEIKMPDGNIFKITGIIAEDLASDLKKMQADIRGKTVPFLTINKSVPEVGDKVVIIGSPKGLESTVSDGIVSAVRDVPGFGSIIQTTAPISPGSSGSAVVNMKGEVLGVASAQIREGQNLNIVIPSAKIIELKEKKQTPSIAKKEDAQIQADDIFSTARFYFLKENYEKALSFYKQHLEINPDFADAWFDAGVCYGKLGRYQKAIQAFKQAIRLKPDYATAHYNLGVAYGELGSHQEEIKAYKQAIRLKPDNADAHYNLGVCYGQLGHYQEAAQAFKQAIRLKPDFFKAYMNLGTAYGKSDRYQEAAQAFKQAIRLKPDNATAHYGLGVTYSKLGLYQEAIQAYKQAIRLKPDYADAHYNLGVAYGKLGSHQEEIKAYKQAIRLKPDYADAHFNLGITCLRMGDSGCALEVYKILKNLNAEMANELFNLIYK